MSAAKISVDGKFLDLNPALYPKGWRVVEIFLDAANKNPGKDTILFSGDEILGWRNDAKN